MKKKARLASLHGYLTIGAVAMGVTLVTSISSGHGGDSHVEMTDRLLPSKANSASPRKFVSSVSVGITQTLKPVSSGKPGSNEISDTEDAYHAPEEEHSDEQDSPYTHEEHTGDASIAAQLTYLASPQFSLQVTLGASQNEKLADAEMAAGYRHSIGSLFSGNLSLVGALPISHESIELKKVTTVTPAYSITFARGNWLLGATTSAGFSFYRVRDKEAVDLSYKEISDGMEGAEESHSEEVHDRELARYSTSFNVGYQLTDQLTYFSALNLARVNWEINRPTWETEVSLAQFSYRVTDVTGSFGVSLRHRDFLMEIPDEPRGQVALQFQF